MKEAVKKSAGSSGIMTINKNIAADVDKLLQKYINDAMQQGVDLDTLSPEQLKMIVAINSKPTNRVISGTSDEGKAITEKLLGKRGEVIEGNFGKSFKEEIDAMKKSGDLVDKDNMVISEKITNREMFKNSNLNKEPISEKFIDYTIQDINKKEPIEGMKIANKIIKREGEFKDLTEEQSKRILKETDDHLTGKDMDYDPEDFYAKGGRISRGGGGTMGASDRGYQGGGRDSKGSVSGTAPGAAPGPGGDRDGPQEPPKVTNNPPPKSVSETVGIETVLENDINPNKFKNYLAANNKFNLQNYLDFQNQFNLLDTNKTYDEYIEMMDNDETLNPFQEDDMNKKSQEILQQFDFEKPLNNNPEIYIAPEKRRYRMAAKTGGRAGLYTGGMVDVEPNLSDIGHGSDALMARTRLVAPDSQATTSTGLNYLLAEDNDNIRVPFAGGGGGRREFLKLLATLGGGVAAAKTGILGLGKDAGKQVTKEVVKEAAGSGTVPPYFLNLVSKIKNLGDDAPRLATKDREKVTTYKDYTLTEDVTTGEQTIQRMKVLDDGSESYYGKPLTEETYMSYKPGKGQMDETTKGKTPPDEYEEGTALLRNDKEFAGDVVDESFEISDDVIKEGTIFEDTLSEFGKADGGRIGYVGGGLSKLGITGSSRKFLEKVFGKEKFKNLIENDPELHRGLLEVAEMFRSKDKSGLVEYMQNFLPQMSKKELEAFVVGSGDTAGIEGQLIRLGSGRDYKNKIEMIEESNNLRKLKDFDVEGVSKNAEGGRIGFSGGGIIRAIIANSAKKKGMSVTDFIKATNYKGLPPEVKMFLSAEDFAKLKSGQKEMYDNYIDMAKTRLEFQKNIEGGKTTPARELFEGMEKTMDEQSMVPKNVTSDDIAEMELMVKNRFNKGRKDNAKGGLQTMLGE